MAVVVVLVMVKLYYINLFLNSGTQVTVADLLTAEVSAQEQQTGPASSAQPDNADNASRQWDIKDDFTWSYDLVLALQKRDEALRIKEKELGMEEERIEYLKGELSKRITELSELKTRIAGLIEQKQTVENEKMRKLAKVFEETPPEQAGPLLSKLDVDIAAQLILKMTGRKAGRIWGYVDPDQAVNISKELARLQPGFKLDSLADDAKQD